MSSRADNIRVIVRKRPLKDDEIKRGAKDAIFVDVDSSCVKLLPHVAPSSSSSSSDLSSTKNNRRQNTWTFDRAIDNRLSQQDIFNQEVKPLVDKALDGFNATIFAYGQSGSGKTFTMSGDVDSGDVSKYGMLPQVVEYLFSFVESNTSARTQFKLFVTYVEIYNEDIRDLLTSGGSASEKLQVHEDPVAQMFYVKGVAVHEVHNFQSCLAHFHSGTKKRKTASTGLNEVSSRSHALFTIKVERHEFDDAAQSFAKRCTGKMIVVDLAGSENHKKSQTSGERFDEGCSINQSLSALGHCIEHIIKKKPHIPYRANPLTRLLKDSLGGNSRTVMFANVGPSHENLLESRSTLLFADGAKKIQNKPHQNVDPVQAQLMALQAENAELRKRLGGDYNPEADAKLREENDALELENSSLKKRVTELHALSTGLQKQVDDLQRQFVEAETRYAETKKFCDEFGALAQSMSQQQLSLPHQQLTQMPPSNNNNNNNNKMSRSSNDSESAGGVTADEDGSRASQDQTLIALSQEQSLILQNLVLSQQQQQQKQGAKHSTSNNSDGGRGRRGKSKTPPPSSGRQQQQQQQGSSRQPKRRQRNNPNGIVDDGVDGEVVVVLTGASRGGDAADHDDDDLLIEPSQQQHQQPVPANTAAKNRRSQPQRSTRKGASSRRRATDRHGDDDDDDDGVDSDQSDTADVTNKIDAAVSPRRGRRGSKREQHQQDADIDKKEHDTAWSAPAAALKLCDDDDDDDADDVVVALNNNNRVASMSCSPPPKMQQQSSSSIFESSCTMFNFNSPTSVSPPPLGASSSGVHNSNYSAVNTNMMIPHYEPLQRPRLRSQQQQQHHHHHHQYHMHQQPRSSSHSLTPPPPQPMPPQQSPLSSSTPSSSVPVRNSFNVLASMLPMDKPAVLLQQQQQQRLQQRSLSSSSVVGEDRSSAINVDDETQNSLIPTGILRRPPPPPPRPVSGKMMVLAENDDDDDSDCAPSQLSQSRRGIGGGGGGGGGRRGGSHARSQTGGSRSLPTGRRSASQNQHQQQQEPMILSQQGSSSFYGDVRDLFRNDVDRALSQQRDQGGPTPLS